MVDYFGSGSRKDERSGLAVTNPSSMNGERPPSHESASSNAPSGARDDGAQQGSSGASAGTGSLLPALTVPKGGGAIRGIGEKFQVNAITGTASLGVPLPISPGRSGFGPQVDLSYDSGAGNGPFGLGFSLSVPSITRKTDKGLPRYFDEDDLDVFHPVWS
jgi:hypothetical protein